MIGINRKDIRAILKSGAKAKEMSTSEFKAEIQAIIDNIINSSDIEEQKHFKQGVICDSSKKIRRIYFPKKLS